jgi:sulfur carrier protein ThiS
LIIISLEFLSWLRGVLAGEGSAGSLRLEQEVEEGQTVRQLLLNIASRYPRFELQVFDRSVQYLNEQVIVLYNGKLLEIAGGLETCLRNGDLLTFVPVIQGG